MLMLIKTSLTSTQISWLIVKSAIHHCHFCLPRADEILCSLLFKKHIGLMEKASDFKVVCHWFECKEAGNFSLCNSVLRSSSHKSIWVWCDPEQGTLPDVLQSILGGCNGPDVQVGKGYVFIFFSVIIHFYISLFPLNYYPFLLFPGKQHKMTH